MGRRQKVTLQDFQAQKAQEQQQAREKQVQEAQQLKQNQNQKRNNNKKKDAKASKVEVIPEFDVLYKPSETEQSIQKVIVQHFCSTSPNLETFDPIVLNYLGCMLNAQNQTETSIDEASLSASMIRILQSHYACDDASVEKASETQAIVKQKLEATLSSLKEQKLIVERVSSDLGKKSHRLEESISLAKDYANVENKHRDEISKQTDDSRWNNDFLDWDKKMKMDLQKKREKKAKKERQQQEKEYSQFLENRGLSLDMKDNPIKIHRKDDGYSGTKDIRLENLTIRIGDRLLLDNASVQLNDGGKYGLIGRNGVGKTTLLRHIFDRDVEGIPVYLQILHVEQEMAASDKSALELVLEADFERSQLMAEERRLLESKEDVGEKLQAIYVRLEEIDAHSAESRASSILHGLSFTQEMMNKPSRRLSGGWRMRIALARALFVEPDILLLDEPTNHLDLHACLFLENYLKSYQNTVVIVSHARSFLNGVVTDILHYTNQNTIVHYKGNYDIFEETRQKRAEAQQKAHDSQQKQISHIQKYIDRFRYKAATAKMAQSRIKLLGKMKVIPEVVQDPQFQFLIPDVEEVQAPHIEIFDTAFGWSFAEDGQLLFKDVNLNVSMESRVALVGANGSGKSSFMSLLLQENSPVEGEVRINRKLRIAHFSQHHSDRLNMKQTPIEYMQSRFPGVEVPTLRAHLGDMGVVGDLQTRPIYTLSGGQKSRVSFAEITYSKPHLLLLDEPTNHLDLDTIDALIHALNNFNGGVLLISHDEYLIERVCDDVWVCEDMHIKSYDGDFQSYKKEQLRKLNFA